MRIEIQVFHVHLTDTAAAQDVACLSPEELSRAERFVQPHHAARFVTGRAALRRILANSVGQAPSNLRLVSGAEGKPELHGIEGAPFFNVSHSGHMAVIAVCHDARIGVDIEYRQPVERDLVERFFSRTERIYLDALPEDEWLVGFYRCWTRKEAFVKALGQGLSLPLQAFDVSLDEKPVLLRCEFSPVADWTFLPVDAGDDYEAVIAVETRGASASTRVMSRPQPGVSSGQAGIFP